MGSSRKSGNENGLARRLANLESAMGLGGIAKRKGDEVRTSASSP
jgi:hypothetical protein